MTEYFIQAFIYLTAAVVAVPLAKRLDWVRYWGIWWPVSLSGR